MQTPQTALWIRSCHQADWGKGTDDDDYLMRRYLWGKGTDDDDYLMRRYLADSMASEMVLAAKFRA
jgi:hypothetical protein